MKRQLKEPGSSKPDGQFSSNPSDKLPEMRPRPNKLFRQDDHIDAHTLHQHRLREKRHYNQPIPGDIPDSDSKQHVTEMDVLRENHRFVRTKQDDENAAWEDRVAKHYYDRLFKGK